VLTPRQQGSDIAFRTRPIQRKPDCLMKENRVMSKLPVPGVVLLVAAAALAAEPKSAALQVGDAVEAFYVKDVTGPAAGTELCYRCRYGNRPVISIFTRKVTEPVASLAKEVDATVGEHADKDLAGFFVLLTDDPVSQEEGLKKLAKDNGIRNLPLTTFNDVGGPRNYKLTKDADVTVMMWVDGTLQVNEAFKAGDLSKEKIAALVKSSEKILN
jgi:hypothetical protein